MANSFILTEDEIPVKRLRMPKITYCFIELFFSPGIAEDFLFPKLPFVVGGESHTLTVDASKPNPELVVQSNSQPVAQYLYRLRQLINEIPSKQDKDNAIEVYEKALKQRTKAAQSLAMALDPKTGKTKAEQDLYKETKLLLDYIHDIWKRLGASDDLLPDEGEVGSYGSLGATPDLIAHHVPQNGILKRVRTWLNAYLDRPVIPGFREHMTQKLAGMGVKYSSLAGYGMNQGVSIRMQKIKHNRTRTFGKLPEDLDIPQGSWSVHGKHAGDERVERLVKLVGAEFQQDINDVSAIYGGQKGMKKVPSYQKVTAAIAKLRSMNRDMWGNFLG